MADPHGQLFDTFQTRSGHPHGGSTYDDGFQDSGASDAHGKLFDMFPKKRGVDRYGERFDTFPMRDMPPLHGLRFDENFKEQIANTEHEHWYDAFSGGAMTRFIYDGVDYEGMVIRVNDGYADVKTREGQTIEVGFEQFLAYGSPNMHQASPPSPASEAHAPSVGIEAADGSNERHAIDTDPLISEFNANRGQPTPMNLQNDRQQIDPQMESSVIRLKSAIEALDVQKGSTSTPSHRVEWHPSHGMTPTAWQPKYSGKPTGENLMKHVGGFEHSTMPGGVNAHLGRIRVRGARIVHQATGEVKAHVGEPFGGSRATIGPGVGKSERSALDVLKEMTSAETAVQAEDDQSVQSDGSHYCKHCGHTCRKARDGKCPTCGHKVEVAKAWDDPIEGMASPETAPDREHKSTDHHTKLKGSPSGSPRRCPYCDQELIDQQTEQGAPSRKKLQGAGSYDKAATAHKCFQGAVADLEDIWKSLYKPCKHCGAPLAKGQTECAHCGAEADRLNAAPETAVPVSST